MATRKPFYNKCEVIDYIGEMPITPSILFGYSKIDNFASVYREDGLVLTPIQNGKLDGFVEGDRLLFRVRWFLDIKIWLVVTLIMVVMQALVTSTLTTMLVILIRTSVNYMLFFIFLFSIFKQQPCLLAKDNVVFLT